MATIHSRLIPLQKSLKKRPLTPQEKVELGKKIADVYHSKKIKIPIQRIQSVEPTGVFNVLSYPKIFIPELDQQIREYLAFIPDIQKRKRIPVKGVKEASFKPKSTQGQIQGQ